MVYYISNGRRIDTHDAPVSRAQARDTPGRDTHVPSRRLLRDVRRGRARRLAHSRCDADPAQRQPDVRRALPRAQLLSRETHPCGENRRALRPGGGPEVREGTRPPRDYAHRHAGHRHGGRTSRRDGEQLRCGGFGAGACPARPLDGRVQRGGLRLAGAARRGARTVSSGGNARAGREQPVDVFNRRRARLPDAALQGDEPGRLRADGEERPYFRRRRAPLLRGDDPAPFPRPRAEGRPARLGRRARLGRGHDSPPSASARRRSDAPRVASRRAGRDAHADGRTDDAQLDCASARTGGGGECAA